MSTCVICGKSNKKIIKHHRSYFPENSIVICYSCHRTLHRLARTYTNHQLVRLLSEIELVRPNIQDQFAFDWSGSRDEDYYEKKKMKREEQASRAIFLGWPPGSQGALQ